jgi:hypothetical protein
MHKTRVSVTTILVGHNLAASPAVVNLDVQTAVVGVNYRF